MSNLEQILAEPARYTNNRMTYGILAPLEVHCQLIGLLQFKIRGQVLFYVDRRGPLRRSMIGKMPAFKRTSVYLSRMMMKERELQQVHVAHGYYV